MIISFPAQKPADPAIDKASRSGKAPRAARRLGQNFLSDPNMAAALCASARPGLEDSFVELCAGAGALTRPLAGSVARIHAVELDSRMLPYLERVAAEARLREGAEISIVHGDALAFDFGQFGQPVRVIGNLAYNVSVPILMRCLYQWPCLIDAHFMVQKEVAERIRARHNSSDYGRLAVMAQTWFDVAVVKKVPPQCFSPRPKVDSSFVRLSRRADPGLDHSHCRGFEAFVRAAFAMRRKSLHNNLRARYGEERTGPLDLAANTRAQELPVAELARLFLALDQTG